MWWCRGDNYYRIARRFGVSLSLLYQVNHISNPSILFVGAVLLIPGSTGPADTTAAGNNPPRPANGAAADRHPAAVTVAGRLQLRGAARR